MAKNSTLSRPPRTPHNFRRAAILFAGGPAPAANAVISAAAVSFLRDDIEVVGIKHGYSQLLQFGPDRPLSEGQDYIRSTTKSCGGRAIRKASSSAPPAPILARWFRARRISMIRNESPR